VRKTARLPAAHSDDTMIDQWVFQCAPVAQLDRASVYGTEGYWFESSRVY
jgi:hypothetical protein